MCFCLYLGSTSAPQTILFQSPKRGVWLAQLRKHDQKVKEKFTLPNVTSVGSDRGCGCGFRHESSEDGVAESQVNHESLVTFLKACFPEEAFVELYSCCWGEFEQDVHARREVSVGQLADPQFRFAERGYYRVNL